MLQMSAMGFEKFLFAFIVWFSVVELIKGEKNEQACNHPRCHRDAIANAIKSILLCLCHETIKEAGRATSRQRTEPGKEAPSSKYSMNKMPTNSGVFFLGFFFF